MMMKTPSVSTEARPTAVCWRIEGARALQEAATSTTLSDIALLLLRLAAVSLLLPQLVLFSLSHDYNLMRITGMASTALALSAAHLSVCSLARVVAWPDGVGAAALGAPASPLLQGAVTLIFFGAITTASLDSPKRWGYPAVAQLLVEPIAAATLVLSSQRMRFRFVYALLPLGAMLTYHVAVLLKYKTSLHVMLPYLDYRRIPAGVIAGTYVKIIFIALASAMFAYMLGHVHTAVKMWRKRGKEDPEKIEVVAVEADPDDEEMQMSQIARDSWMDPCGRQEESSRSLEASRATVVDTNEHLPWFSRPEISFDDAPEWIHVESEYGSKTVDTYNESQ